MATYYNPQNSSDPLCQSFTCTTTDLAKAQDQSRLNTTYAKIDVHRWSAKRGPEFTWEREDQMKLKYPCLFANFNETATS
ncbi:hypothetical protein LXL04_013047 [Taraxacum kok-saghyz]